MPLLFFIALLLLAFLLALFITTRRNRNTAPGAEHPDRVGESLTEQVTIKFNSPCSVTYPRGSGSTFPFTPEQTHTFSLYYYGVYTATQWFSPRICEKVQGTGGIDVSVSGTKSVSLYSSDNENGTTIDSDDRNPVRIYPTTDFYFWH